MVSKLNYLVVNTCCVFDTIFIHYVDSTTFDDGYKLMHGAKVEMNRNLDCYRLCLASTV